MLDCLPGSWWGQRNAVGTSSDRGQALPLRSYKVLSLAAFVGNFVTGHRGADNATKFSDEDPYIPPTPQINRAPPLRL